MPTSPSIRSSADMAAPNSSTMTAAGQDRITPTLQKSNSSSTLPTAQSFSHIPNLFEEMHHEKMQSSNYENTSILSIAGGISPPHSPSPPPMQPDAVDPTIIDPSIVFYHLHQFSGCDTTETYKIGVIYVGVDQRSEEEFLSNSKGSPRYHKFLNSIGEKVRISERIDVYPGGLDRSGKSDGELSVHWRDRITQVIFHVTTMMPNIETDQMYTNKKRHIGNDYVNIIFSDAPSQDFCQSSISGQFNFVNIIIYPLDIGWYRVEIKKRKDIPIFGPIHDNQIVSEQSLASLVIHTAINAN
eukprot:gene14222-16779_t